MFHALKNKTAQADLWQPSTSLSHLHKRAALLQQIRAFFYQRNVLEVETPLLCQASVTDPHIESIAADLNQTRFYLQTSPEYAMKRLLCAGAPSIFQICKCFRAEEKGDLHNPEFTMLEWYRLDYDEQDLMQEVDALLQATLASKTAEKISYRLLFKKFLQLDINRVSAEELQNCAKQHHLEMGSALDCIDDWLNLLLSHLIEPQLGLDSPCFVYDFPISQSALAKVEKYARRFEVYVQGMELANGFFELQDSEEHRRRFTENNLQRKKMGLPSMPIDELFLASLEHGLPDCAGVALGLDRLLMVQTGSTKIQSVLSFDISRV